MAKVLVIDDDPSLLRALRLGLRPGATRSSPPPTASRASPRRRWPHPTSSSSTSACPTSTASTVCRRIRQMERRPDRRPLGHRHRRPKGRRPRRRSRRLRHQALRHGRARGPHPHRHPPPQRGTRRSESRPTLSVGPLELDLVHHEAHLRRQPRRAHRQGVRCARPIWPATPGGPAPTQMILIAVWGDGYGGEAQYLHAYVHRLRQKLNDPSGTADTHRPGRRLQPHRPTRRRGPKGVKAHYDLLACSRSGVALPPTIAKVLPTPGALPR